MRRLFLIVIVFVLVGCSTTPRGPYTPMTELSRNTVEASRLNREAIAVIDSNPERAEQLLREALTADLWHAPSHNSLGVLALQRGDLYTAANEFEWARKLMPGHPDPRLNLALTLEKAGRFNEALAEYDAALEDYPNHLPTILALTRLQIRRGLEDERTDGFLKEIALRGDVEWRGWVQRVTSNR